MLGQPGRLSYRGFLPFLSMQNLSGQALLIEEVINQGLCVLCGACVGLCPYFDCFDGKVVVLDQCHAETWKCLQVCPRADYEAEPNPMVSRGSNSRETIGPYQNIFMARATDDNIRRNAQYGGVVSAVVTYALHRGYVNSTVLTDAGNAFSPGGRLVTKSSEVLDCSGSRYTASGGLSALNRALRDGENRIGVVGLPCQMEALNRMRLMKPDGEERYAGISLKIGLFCTWALGYRQLRDFLKAEGVEGPVKRYDIPPPPAEKFIIQNGSKMKEFPLAAVRPLVQKGCGLCQDMTAEWADISVGAAEGFDGWNTVLVRTDAGADLIQNGVREGLLETKELPERNLKHLQEASLLKWQRGKKARHELDRGQR